MKTYCNARLSVLSPAHKLPLRERSRLIDSWLRAHSDEDVLDKSKRGPLGVNDGASLSVAFSITPSQATRLSGLLDGRRHTLSALVRSIFEDMT